MHPEPSLSLITPLDAALKYKLTAISQYFLHARMLKHAGNLKLADFAYKSSIEAMKHSDMLVDAILTAGGRPNLEALCPLRVGDSPRDMLESDLALAQETMQQIGSALPRCENAAGSRLLSMIAASQQEHVDALAAHLQQADFPARCAQG